jgi:glycosyltransferase involved in cell wall biosynthesis
MTAAVPAEEYELSIVMPCLNEAETLNDCIRKALGYLERSGIKGEVVVADNGSSDGSQQIARALGARVIDVPAKGYGSALINGIRAARGRYVVMGDADDSYDFANIAPFLDKLREGYELVMGNRFLGGIAAGAMPPLHRYLGNPVLSSIGRLFFAVPIGDFHCGMRGFDREALLGLDLKTTGMEFASEMVVQSALHRFRIAEVPTTLSVDGRSRPPHLRSWRDGWRHLRFLLIFSPRWLFLYPGLAIFLLGLCTVLWLLPGSRTAGSVVLDIHTLLFGSLFTTVGFQLCWFAVLSRSFGVSAGLLPNDGWTRTFSTIFTLERGVIIGGLLLAAGVALAFIAVGNWKAVHFGSTDPSSMMRVVIPAMLLIVCGIQTIFGSFFLAFLEFGRGK